MTVVEWVRNAPGHFIILGRLAATIIEGGTMGCALTSYWDRRVAINNYLETLPGDRRAQKLGTTTFGVRESMDERWLEFHDILSPDGLCITIRATSSFMYAAALKNRNTEMRCGGYEVSRITEDKQQQSFVGNGKKGANERSLSRVEG
jgi:hypothetical protein